METNGKIVEDIGRRQYLQIYDVNIICDIIDIEKEAIDGLRIIQFTYRKVLRHFFSGSRDTYVDSDTRYGLINDKNELVSKHDYLNLTRLNNGNISALYPDPKEKGDPSWKEERFSFTLNTKGEPLFRYNVKEEDGTKTTKYFALKNVDAVSSCYYGIALFVRDHKIGVVDYKGKVLIEPIYDDIIIDKNNNCLTTIVFDEKHYEGFDTRHLESLESSTSYVFKRSKYWPLSLHKLNTNYYVKTLFKYRDQELYYLINKKNSFLCVCIYYGWGVFLSPEYKDLQLLNHWYLFNNTNDNDALFKAVNFDGKYGIICMPTESVDCNPDTGDPIYKEPQTICPFVYDYIAGNESNYITRIILVKDGKEGLFSCSERRILVECVIPTIQEYHYSILPFSFGEGLIGCEEEVVDSKSYFSFKSKRYYFADLKGNRVLEIPRGWEIISAFKNGVAQISTGKHFIKTADIDKFGNIKVTKEEFRHVEDDSYDDIERMYRDAFEDDPNMEWNVD